MLLKKLYSHNRCQTSQLVFCASKSVHGHVCKANVCESSFFFPAYNWLSCFKKFAMSPFEREKLQRKKRQKREKFCISRKFFNCVIIWLNSKCSSGSLKRLRGSAALHVWLGIDHLR